MRIHRIRIQHCGGVEDCEVVFADEGVTIIEGQNEVGKTTLLRAVDYIIEYPDSSNAGPVKSIKPVGRDEGAEVEVDVSTGPYRFTYRKRWHRQKLTELTVVEPRHEQLTGRDAHGRVQAMLDESLDEALWSALKLTQGSELSQATFAEGGSLGRALDQAAGGDAGDGREDDLWSRVQDERARYWTATGQPKVDRTALATKLDDARSRVADLTAELRDLDADTEAVSGLVDQAGLLDQRARDSEDEVRDLETRQQAIASYRNDVRQLEVECAAARARYEFRAEAVDRRHGLAERVDEHRRSAEAADEDVERAGPTRRAAEAEHKSLSDELERARQNLDAAEADHRQASDDESYRRQQIELEQLSERHERTVNAQDLLTAAEAVVESSLVDDQLLAGIEAANLNQVRAEAAAASGAVALEATALADVDLLIDGSPTSLAKSETTEVVINDTAEIMVGELLRLDVRAGSEAHDLAGRLTTARAALARLCQQAGVEDVDQAQAANRARRDAERTITEASKTIKQDLRDLTLESLAQKVARLTERTESYEAGRPAGPSVPEDFEAAKLVTVERETALTEARESVARLDGEVRVAATTLGEAEVGDATLAEKARQARSNLTIAESELETVRADKPDATLLDEATSAKGELGKATVDLTDAEQALRVQDPESVEALLQNAVAARRRTADELRVNLEETQRLRTSLEIKGEEGLAFDLDEAETELQHLEREHERVEARARAAEMLHQVLDEHRTKAHRRYVAPFKDGIEQLGRIVFGESLEVELDEDLRVARRTLDGVTVDFDLLSTGAQEQLGLIGRLACAAIVSADGGAPVVFDDALGWTDPARLDRMGAAIALAGRKCQIIVLTCTPGRYANVGTANVVRLPA